jgi:hypothetical protein
VRGDQGCCISRTTLSQWRGRHPAIDWSTYARFVSLGSLAANTITRLRALFGGGFGYRRYGYGGGIGIGGIPLIVLILYLALGPR